MKNKVCRRYLQQRFPSGREIISKGDTLHLRRADTVHMALAG